jgi:hypothetical protein
MAYLGGNPLVVTSDAISKTLILADASGPIDGMNETGSQLAIMTLRLLMRNTETSTPGFEPTTIFGELAPANLLITSVIIFRAGLPNCNCLNSCRLILASCDIT